MSESSVTTNRLHDAVVGLQLDRPPVNALNPQFLSRIDTALDLLEGDDTVRAVVLSGAGKVLSGGMDLKELLSFSVADQCSMVQALNETFGRLYGFPKPVICAAHGAAIAGGLFFVLASDYRIAGERAQFGLAEMRVGVEFPIGPMAIARAELSAAACRRFMLGGANHDAATAAALGVVDEVLPAQEVLPRAVEVASQYAALPPRTYAATKRSLRAEVLARIESAREPDAERLAAGWFSEETLRATRTVLDALSGRPAKVTQS